ncbi:hypothetical protein BKP45_19285 [Anaerobacillus alkalidiazotrophicus]|uniref:Alanyl-transfer RNA synthetases family profile domain-containing protein n=1 Tax=Anaerobacillus alkalidiazotrophicus TaxID=472963 RepID=A0A1S2LZD9_9BACI|nr:alanyl-tRNA editing protein [Anaerobacillus alkalidiazotrophicus]OIJ17716.1 hypothetical protein BKP45_19285 [Anaerobacillus alkalidiazotrophicus]
MTKRIYEVDPYLKECTALVQNTKIINDEYWVKLDQTIFYPESGGQPYDVGFIDNIPVLEVQYFDNGLYHKVNEYFEKTRVKLTVDYKRRFDHMQQHTGQHLLSAVWVELYQIKTVSFHLGKDVCTIDLATTELSNEQIDTVENKIAHYISENRSVENYILPYDEVDDDRLIKLKERPEFVRFIEIEGIDSSTCCGTHVSMLGEINMIKILGWEKYKQRIRLTFICGLRATKYFQEVTKSVYEVSKKLNVSPLTVKDRFLEFYQKYQLLKKNYQKLYERDLHHEAKILMDKAKANVIEVSWEEKPIQEMKDLAKIIIESGDKVVFFQNQNQKTWIFASSSSQLFNVSTCIQTLKDLIGGNGGGNPVFGQWTGNIDTETWETIKKQLKILT